MKNEEENIKEPCTIKFSFIERALYGGCGLKTERDTACLLKALAPLFTKHHGKGENASYSDPCANAIRTLDLREGRKVIKTELT